MRKLAFLLMVAMMVVVIGCKKTETTSKPKKAESTSGDKKLTLTVPEKTSVVQGKDTNIKVSITRKGFEDEVNVKLEDLPKGVKAKDASLKIEKGKDSAEFTISAEAKAPAKTGVEAKVTASAPGGLNASETIKIDVNAKADE